MSISKKLRFEVFKRDGFRCAYCGKSPPQAILEIDHIEPRSLEGQDDINNLITACFDCNRGKKNIKLDKIPLKISENLEILREQEEQLFEYREFIEQIERRINNDLREINEIYNEAYPDWEFSEKFKKTTLKTFIKLLPLNEIIDSLEIAISKFPNDKDTVINYFCGICWRKIRGTQWQE